MKVQKTNSDLKMTQLLETYEREIYDLTQLIEICKGLNSTLIDYNRLIDSILLTCMGQMQLTKAGIFLKKSIDEDIFVFHRNYKGFDLDHSKEYDIRGDSSLIDFLETHYQCFDMHELVEKIDNYSGLDTMKLIAPNLIIPLKGKDKLNGIIVLGDRIKGDFFNEYEKDYLMKIASLCGVAIHNAYLYEMATTDMMTKLKLHHFFQTSLIEARERAVSENTNLSLIMMDIDHFKDFNDKYGHICGDIIMKNVGRMILEKVRRIDVASRYGGEEFAIILPETDLDEAYLIAERIRESIQNMVVEYDNKKMSITVSIGITVFSPVEDIDNHFLIERADKALYLSKEKGRNRTTAYH
jgi:two-component system, cell cycle response regulator